MTFRQIDFRNPGFRLLIQTLAVLILTSSVLTAQEYDLKYDIPSGVSLKYHRIINENAYAELHSSLSAQVAKRKESVFQLTGVKHDGRTMTVTYLQDTVYVEETPPPTDRRQSVVINNILSQVPVQLTITAKGELLDAVAEKNVRALKGLTDYPATEKQIARMAMILPALPNDKIEAGQIWTAQSKDTTIPYADLGERNSLRIQTANVTYRAEGLETLGQRSCMKVSWKGTTLLEEKHIEEGQERYAEETTRTSGAYYIDIDKSILVQLVQEVEVELTTVYFGKKNGVVPFTNSLHTTVRLQE